VDFLNLFEDGVILLALGLVNRIVRVFARHRPVGGDDKHAQLVDVKELGGLGFRRAGHARQLVVKAEIVLDGNRRQRLRLTLDLNLLLGLNRLVQAVAPPPPRHQAARVFVHDDDLVALDDILHVLLVQTIRLEQLGNGMNALGFGFKLLLEPGFRFQPLARVFLRPRVDRMQRRRQVRQHKGIRVLRAEVIAPLFGEVRLVALFVDREEQLFLLLVELNLLLVGVQLQFSLVHQAEVLGFLQQL